ncbi:MAG: enoyl-CoA hydratase [Pseudonocardia sp. SCN 72-86]|nr:MAG: enoyl-CoA hydratase [Pseudonocardia sp. SCN 72-86]
MTTQPDATGPTVTYRVGDAVANIELNRPHALNAWTPAMGREILSAVRRASADADVRAVLITGAGRAFCAGADVKDERELLPDGTPDLGTRLREIYNPLVWEIRTAPKPFVAAVQGACAGLGVALALACDLVVASEDAFLLLAFARIGVMPDGGTTAFLAERIGLTRAAELCMLAERLPAAKAESWGLVNSVHPVDELRGHAEKLAARLADAPTVALASIKQALREAVQGGLERQLQREAELQQRHGRTGDYAEGRAAFMEKRPAAFRGR